MHAVIGAADAAGEPLIALLGDQRFYRRFGFVEASRMGILAPDPAWARTFRCGCSRTARRRSPARFATRRRLKTCSERQQRQTAWNRQPPSRNASRLTSPDLARAHCCSGSPVAGAAARAPCCPAGDKREARQGHALNQGRVMFVLDPSPGAELAQAVTGSFIPLSAGAVGAALGTPCQRRSALGVAAGARRRSAARRADRGRRSRPRRRASSRPEVLRRHPPRWRCRDGPRRRYPADREPTPKPVWDDQAKPNTGADDQPPLGKQPRRPSGQV